MSLTSPHYSECSKYTNRSTLRVCIRYYLSNLSTMHCWNGLSLN